MTKEITKAYILQNLQDKFKLREFTPDKFLFDETVVPIYDVGKELDAWNSKNTTVSITSGPTNFLFFTVPQNERWELSTYNVVFLAAGAHKVTGLNVIRLGGTNVYFDMKKGQTESYIVNLPKLVTLNPGDTIYLYIDDYTSTASLRLYIDYILEEIR